jgi:hypothetical protein
VVKFHLSYGAHIYRTTELDIFYEFHKHQYPEMLRKFKGFHQISL